MEHNKLLIDVLEGLHPGEKIMVLDGVLNADTAFRFGDRAREQEAQTLLIDLTNVPSLDSSGLGVLIGLHVSCEKSGRPLLLVGLNDRVSDVFRICKIDGVFTTYPTLADAEQALAVSTGTVSPT